MNQDLVRLVTLAPGHFHAALVQKAQLPGVDPQVHVYAPDDTDLTAHMERIKAFNTRSENPTRWVTEVHSGPDWLDRFLPERLGNAVVIAGRNRPKIDLILAAVSNGYCVLADKPWVVEPGDFAKLEQVFAEAERTGVFAWDIMTERWEATTRLQRKLMSDPEVFGTLQNGTGEEPALVFESIHSLSKRVTGNPLRRPTWWFDPAVAGEALADVGTHLADLSMWLAFPDQAIDYQRDIEVMDAENWPTRIDREAFAEITGLKQFPEELSHLKEGDTLSYWGNGRVLFRIRDKFVRFTTRWGVRPTGPDADTHQATARGSKATISILHDSRYGRGPQVFLTPNRGKGSLHVDVPPAKRTGHEAHFASVLGEFVKYFHNRSQLPAWERPNLLAKYFITTKAVEKARARSQATHQATQPAQQSWEL